MFSFLPFDACDDKIASVQVLKSIAGQSAFQLAIMYAIVFHTQAVFGAGGPGDPSTLHSTLVFNAFVQLQLFNQINARKIADEPNVLAGILDNRLFLGILGAEFLLQACIRESRVGRDWGYLKCC